MSNVNEEAEEIFLKTEYKTRLAITLFVLNKIWEHAVNGRSYRYLIYERLKFDSDAYSFFNPVGMNISSRLEVRNENDSTGETVINHEEALELAYIKRQDSNLARGYIELTAKVQELEEKNHALFQDYGLLKINNDFNKTHLKSTEELIAELEKQVEDMKCCGNCKYLVHFNRWKILCGFILQTKKEDKEVLPNHICYNWQSDNLTRSERNGKVE